MEGLLSQTTLPSDAFRLVSATIKAVLLMGCLSFLLLFFVASKPLLADILLKSSSLPTTTCVVFQGFKAISNSRKKSIQQGRDPQTAK